MITELFLLLSSFGLSLGLADGPIVETPLGKVQGTYKYSYQNRIYSAFEGIPYAKPPVGKLRFAEPQPSEKWDGILLADTTYSCLVYSTFPMSLTKKNQEDCLYAYVYVPREKINPGEKLDVIVHIHGGGFMMGAPAYLAGPDYLMDRDVVFVSFNYRLAMLGFLSTEDDVVPGNMGLKDQTMALRWIKENIEYFSGNPDSVTLTGESAGAASVHFHYFSPLSKGLFHRGISQSGTTLTPWSLSYDNLNKTKKLGEYFNCNTESTKEIVDCLRKIDEDELVEGQKSLYVFMDSVPFPLFAPTIEKGIEGAFLIDHPYKLMKSGQVYDVPWVASNTKDEGIFPTCIFVFLHMLEQLEEKWDDLAPYLFSYVHTAKKADLETVTKKIRQYYFQDETLDYNNTDPLVKVFSDRHFLIDGEKSVKLHAKVTQSPVYYYFFEYIMEQSFFMFSNMKRGAAHGDDSRFYLKVFGSPETLPKWDEKMMELFIDFITTYARTGVPTFKNMTWTPVQVNSNKIDYMDIVTPENVKMKATEHISDRYEFWQNLPLNENEKLE